MNKKFTDIINWALVLLIALTSYSCTLGIRSESKNIINAPIDVVWRNSIDILKAEEIALKKAISTIISLV